MKAILPRDLPSGNWLYEVKFDGYRGLVFKADKDARLVSRNRKAFIYPELVDALKLLSVKNAIIDGLCESYESLHIRRSYAKLPRMTENVGWRAPGV